MTALTAGPCSPWTPLGCQTIPTAAAAISGVMLDAASYILWAKSGRQFDECVVTLRPCRRECFDVWPDEWGVGWPNPILFAGQWFNMGCGFCTGDCSCNVLHQIMLPSPTSAVTEVKIDGVALTPPEDHFILYDYRQLIRTDGEAWPSCNDLSQDDTHVGTWSVTFRVGVPVPPLGQLAVGELWTELMNACIGAPCKLPSPVQQLVRQGVSLTMFDPNVAFADGKIGLRLSDLFISTVNPGGIPARAQVYDPDARGPRMQTWPS